MHFEKVHMIRDIYDASEVAQRILAVLHTILRPPLMTRWGDYTQHFRLYAVNAQFMEREFRPWAIYRTWEARFHRGHLGMQIWASYWPWTEGPRTRPKC